MISREGSDVEMSENPQIPYAVPPLLVSDRVKIWYIV
jgi:hypothetical protein